MNRIKLALFATSLAIVIILSAVQAFAQALPVCNWGDMIYKALSAYGCLPYDNTPGKFLKGQGASAQPVWSFQADPNFLLPAQSTNTFLGNTSGTGASPIPNTVSQILDTVGYDISRPPSPGAIIYKSAVAPNNAWQALQPGFSGQVLSSGGAANPPFWSTVGSIGLDSICTTQGAVLYRGASLWSCLAPGTSGQFLTAGGVAANPSWTTVGTAGFVTGPSSATDSAIALFDTTTGKLIKNSLSTVDGTGAIVVPASFVANTGRITVGTGGTLTSQNAAYQDQRTVSTSGTSLHGYAFDINLDAPGGYGVGGFDCRFNTLGSQNYDHINCFQSNITYSSLGTLTNHIGYLHQPHFTAGTVTNNTGLFISNPDLTGGGTLTNNIGIFIDSQTSGASNIAIQTNGTAPSQFGGNVISLTQFEVRNALPEVKLSNAAGTPFSAWFSDGTNVTLKNYIAGSLFFQTNAANVVELSSTLLRPSNDNVVGLGDALHRYTNVNATGYLATGIPVTQTGTTGTVGANDGSIIVNASGPFTETLPAAANFPGRWLHVKSIAAQTIVSLSSNVVPLAGGAAGTALLASGAGKWANLQSDGTNWVVMSGN